MGVFIGLGLKTQWVRADGIPLVYVDDSWASIPVGQDPDGSGPAQAFGIDAFTTIQAGIDAVDTYGTVFVASGTYSENLVITKSVTLKGPNAGLDPNIITREPEAVIHPAHNDTELSSPGSVIIKLEANHVILDGFTLDGDNPAIAPGVLLNEADANAAYGVSNWEIHQTGITVTHNIIKNLVGSAVQLFGNEVAFGSITHNQFDNMPSSATEGLGIYAGYNFYANISDNVMTRVYNGIQYHLFWLPTTDMPSRIERNQIQSTHVGIWYNQHSQNASPTTITSNTLTSPPDAPGVGLWFSNIQNAAAVTATDNIITGTDIGIKLFNIPNGNAYLSGGIVSQTRVGIWADNYSSTYGIGSGTSQVIVNGMTIQDASDAGIYVWDNPISGTHAITLFLQGDTVIHNALRGAVVENARAALNVHHARFTANAEHGIYVNDGEVVLAGATIINNGIGIYIHGTGTLDVVSSTIANNLNTGVVLSDTAGGTLHNNSICNNGASFGDEAVELDNQTLLDVDARGNWWCSNQPENDHKYTGPGDFSSPILLEMTVVPDLLPPTGGTAHIAVSLHAPPYQLVDGEVITFTTNNGIFIESDNAIYVTHTVNSQVQSLLFSPDGVIDVTVAVCCGYTQQHRAESARVLNMTTQTWFREIQDAIDTPTTHAGQTISATAGSYTEPITITKSITLTGMPGVILYPQNNGPDDIPTGSLIRIEASDVRVQDLILDGDYVPSGDVAPFGISVISESGGPFGNGVPLTNITLENITIRNTQRGIQAWGVHNFTIRRSQLENIGEEAIMLENSDAIQVHDNTIHTVHTGIRSYLTGSSIIASNTITLTQSTGAGISIAGNILDTTRLLTNSITGGQCSLMVSDTLTYTSSLILAGNTLYGSQIGLEVNSHYGGVVLQATNNTFQSEENPPYLSAGIVFTGTSPITATLGGSPKLANIFRNAGENSNVQVFLPDTAPTIAAYWNDWGYTTVSEIENTLYHAPDNVSYGNDDVLTKIDFYTLTLTGTPPTQPANGITPITLTATITGFLIPSAPLENGGGDEIVFTTSLGSLANPVQVTDAYGQATIILTSTLNSQIQVTATAGITVNNITIATTTVEFTAAPILTLYKTDRQRYVRPGELLTYTLVLGNIGTGIATPVLMTDTLPAHTTFVHTSNNGTETMPGIVTWPPINLNSLAHLTHTVVARVNDTVPADLDTITNQVVATSPISSTEPAPPAMATAQDTNIVIASPVLTITKSNQQDNVIPGTILTYTLTITNTGDREARYVTITDTLPGNVTLLTVSDGGDEGPPGYVTWPPFTLNGNTAVATRTLTLQIGKIFSTSVEAITNTATFSTGNGNAGIVYDRDPILALPDLVLTKHDNGNTVTPGESIYYTLTYTNSGTQTAVGVRITETVPAHTTFNATASTRGWECSAGIQSGSLCIYALPDLPVDEGGSINFVVTVTTPIPAGVVHIQNIARIGDDGTNGPDADPKNNIAEVQTALHTTLNLVLSKTNQQHKVKAGETLTYTLTLTNSGNQGATNICITDTLGLEPSAPSYVTVLQVSNAGTISHNTITWTVPMLPGGASLTRTVTLQLTDPLPSDIYTFTNSAVVTDDGTNGPEVNSEDNIARDSDRINGIIDLRIQTYGHAPQVYPGALITYTLLVDNTGTWDIASILVTDTLPFETQFIGASHAGQAIEHTVTWPTFKLHAGQRYTLTVMARVNPDVAQGTILTNTALVTQQSALGSDITPENNQIQTTTSVKWRTVYLPLTMRNYISGPDLVVDTITVITDADTGDRQIEVTIRNQGSQSVTTTFWVDLYLNPDPPPTAVNQVWQDVSEHGATWGITSNALPIAPGTALRLRTGEGQTFFRTDLSDLPSSIPGGTKIYAHVDSANVNTTYGAVLETHERQGQPYNNITYIIVTSEE
ncbi:MAG: DUF11 domain-containing protein [Anaerolineae bacterium]|nr:DUF11 domain-containing protein [Anaerolineae bacterium]